MRKSKKEERFRKIAQAREQRIREFMEWLYTQKDRMNSGVFIDTIIEKYYKTDKSS